MSAEVVAKKRGRPKKIVSEPIEVESIKTTTTRAKSTKAITKPVPAKTVAAKSATATKPIPASKTAPVSVRKTSAPKVVTPKSSLPKAPTPISTTANTIKSPPPTNPKPAVKVESRKDTVQASKILSQVQEKHGSPTTKFTASQPSSKQPTPSSQILPPRTAAPLSNTPVAGQIESVKIPVQNPPHVAPPTKAAQPPSAASSTPKPAPLPLKSPPPPPTAAPAPKPPIAALNSAIVNNIATRAGAKPVTRSSKALPPNYKSSARKVTMVIVALPLLVFSSYGLYQRCEFVGVIIFTQLTDAADEVKLLFNPGLKKVDKEVTSTPTTNPSSAS